MDQFKRKLVGPKDTVLLDLSFVNVLATMEFGMPLVLIMPHSGVESTGETRRFDNNHVKNRCQDTFNRPRVHELLIYSRNDTL